MDYQWDISGYKWSITIINEYKLIGMHGIYEWSINGI